MVLSEAEARQKVCPVVNGMCKGSACMAWRSDWPELSGLSWFADKPMTTVLLGGFGLGMGLQAFWDKTP